MTRTLAGAFFGVLLGASLSAPCTAAAVEEKPRPLTITEAVALALEHNPSLREADGKVLEGLAGVELAEADRRPALRADARYVHLSDVPSMDTIPGQPPRELGEDDTLTGMVSASWTVFSGGRIGAALRQAVSSAEAQSALRERVRQGVVFGVERSFLALLGAQNEVEVARRALEAAEGHVRVAASRLEARAAARYDVIRADVEAEEARQRLVAARSAVEAAHASLIEALGLGDGKFEAVDPGTSDGEPPPTGELIRAARERRPELAALDRQEEAAEAGFDLARGERLPTVSLAADWQEVSPDAPFQYDRWSLGAVVSVPLFDGGKAAARKALASAKREQVRAARESVVRQVESQVRQAVARHRSAAAQIPVAEKRVAQAEELVRLAEVRYREGVGTATEATDARASLTAARQGLVRARVALGQAEAELRWATGSSTPVDSGTREVPR